MEASIFPLSISENGNYLVTAGGDPFLYMADTGWWILDSLSEADWELYLQKRKEQGFNAVQVMMIWTYYKKNHDGETPFEEPCMLSTPNEAYFAYVDRFVELAKKKELLINFVPLWLGYSGEEWFKVLDKNTADECYDYGVYLGERYGDCSNVMWTIGGDHDPEGLYDKIDALARGIKDSAPCQIMSAHTWENQIATDKYGEAGWLDLNSVYTYFPKWNHGKQVYELAGKAYELGKPFILIESGYENASISDEIFVTSAQLRRQTYWALLSGATGYAYGNKEIWQFTALWKKALEDEGVSQALLAGEILKEHNWHEMSPYRAGHVGNDPGMLALANGDESDIIIYYPPGGERKCYLEFQDSDSLTWIDPVSGNRIKGAVADGKPVYPGQNDGNDYDWVLCVSKQ